jgi:hypothetical protein
MESPIRIMQILDSLNRGGAEMLVLDVCRKGREHGLDITMVATGKGDLEQEFASSGVPFILMKRKSPSTGGLFEDYVSRFNAARFKLFMHIRAWKECMHSWQQEAQT